MGSLRTVLVAAAAILVGVAIASPGAAAVACEAVGEASSIGGGLFEYRITITWGFMGAALPDRFDIVIAHLEDCGFYEPGGQLGADYIVPGHGASTAADGCLDVQGAPTTEIQWVGEVRLEDPDCWLPALHIAYENTYATESCLPLSDDTGVFRFTSFGFPMPVETYYDVILIKAGDFCIFCDYTGPLPDCNAWSPVETTRWGTIKALYR
jgi:hypothetical protein